MEGDNTIMGDFNCKEVYNEEMSLEGDDSWGNVLHTRKCYDTVDYREHKIRNNEKPSKLDLDFTKEPEIMVELKYLTPFGKSDHTLLKLEIKENVTNERNEKQRRKTIIQESELYWTQEDFPRDKLHTSIFFATLPYSIYPIPTTLGLLSL